MRTISLSPAGRQPVKIASYIAIEKKDQFAGLRNLIKSATKAVTMERALIAAATVGAVIAWCAAISLDTTGSAAAAVTLAASSITAVAALCVASCKKGGEL